MADSDSVPAGRAGARWRAAGGAPSAPAGAGAPGALYSVRACSGSARHTFFCFHFPRLKITALTTASVEKATATERKSPRGPSDVCFARTYASGISHNQKTNTFNMVGVKVSPAPLNDDVSTMPYA